MRYTDDERLGMQDARRFQRMLQQAVPYLAKIVDEAAFREATKTSWSTMRAYSSGNRVPTAERRKKIIEWLLTQGITIDTDADTYRFDGKIADKAKKPKLKR